MGGGQQIDTEALLSQAEQRFEAKQLSRQHPDWKQIDADPEFADFVATLPAERQQALQQASNDYDSSVIGAEMTAFKVFKTKPATKPQEQPDPASARRSRISAAVTPRGNGGDTGTNPNDEFMAGFNSG